MIKILLLGVIVCLFSPDLFYRLGGCWFPELETTSELRCRVTTRQRSWWAFAGVLTLLVIVLAVLYLLNDLRSSVWIGEALN